MLGFSSVGSNSTFSKWVLTNWFLLMKSFPLQPKQGLQFFFFWDDPAGCRSVSRRRWASAIGWRRDICCQGHGLLQRGGVRRRQEPVEMPAAPSGFHILLWIFNLLGKKNKSASWHRSHCGHPSSKSVPFSFSGFPRKWSSPSPSWEHPYLVQVGGRGNRSNKTNTWL